MRTVLVSALMALAVLLAACGQGQGQSTSGPDLSTSGPDITDSLVGIWHTTSRNAALGGSVDVSMELRSNGTLRVVVSAGASNLAFPGSWSVVDGIWLRLQGAWFQPGGEVTVRWRIVADELLLEDDTGAVQRWRRQT